MRITLVWGILFALVPVLMLLASCDPSSAGTDAGLPDAIQCEQDSDCRDDGNFCNGRPSCVEEVFMTARGPWRLATCQRGDPPCARELCDEERESCACPNPDADGDGHSAIGCGGDDCDDDDPVRYPGNSEVCDRDNRDEDCNPSTFGIRDADADGSPDAQCCNRDVCGDDCDDTRRSTHPTAVEACDAIDNDCDGAADEGVLVPSYTDADGDGWGTGAIESQCAGLPHYANIDGDCDDELSQVHPGAFRCADGANIEFCDAATWVPDTCPGLGLCVPQPDGTGVCLPGDEGFPECSDGLDNDGDTQTDWSDPQCSSPLDNTEAERECADGADNDDDGVLDFPDDPGCGSTEDNDEEDPATPAACSNGLDDDNDGTVDYVGGAGDPGCVSAADPSEREAAGPTCDNGVDDDGDGGSGGGTDYPADKSCSGPNSDAERVPSCANGLDDDFDGAIDFPSDPGCDNAADDGERGAPNGNYICDNTVDDDLDGVADYPGDPGCSGVQDATEQ